MHTMAVNHQVSPVLFGSGCEITSQKINDLVGVRLHIEIEGSVVYRLLLNMPGILEGTRYETLQ